MIEELDRVALTTDVPEDGLVAGDVGTVVHVHDGGAGYVVEFMSHKGETVAIATVRAAWVRPVGSRDIVHARAMA
ncbi:MAG: DUF4926 domain-containing protein [Hyphomicrobiaceae bacterium]|nr:DUF4926 domain-containing protein [Hyphomicrobiaceae bacterium]